MTSNWACERVSVFVGDLLWYMGVHWRGLGGFCLVLEELASSPRLLASPSPPWAIVQLRPVISAKIRREAKGATGPRAPFFRAIWISERQGITKYIVDR